MACKVLIPSTVSPSDCNARPFLYRPPPRPYIMTRPLAISSLDLHLPLPAVWVALLLLPFFLTLPFAPAPVLLRSSIQEKAGFLWQEMLRQSKWSPSHLGKPCLRQRSNQALPFPMMVITMTMTFLSLPDDGTRCAPLHRHTTFPFLG